MFTLFRRPNMAQPTLSNRFRLWIDAVGGFLICLSDEIVVGQAIPGHAADLAILGDISRRHVKIHRRGEGYFVEPIQATSVGGQVIAEPALLAHGDEITLGRNVRLGFRKPNALSATATLTMASFHRTEPSADQVLLMGESCILGPGPASHVICPQWTHDVILFRRGSELFIHANETIEVDGERLRGKGRLTRHSRVVGEEFSLSLEEV